MKKHIWTLIALFVFSCSSSKDIAKQEQQSEYKIVNTPLIVENDTIYVNELRFYKIQSALDGMKLMYKNYGEWNKKIDGKHQQNINRIIWSNVKLLEHSNEKFTVIVDGTETMSDYFACLIVYDALGDDCFKMGHPKRDALTELFVNKMNKLGRNSSMYKLFK